MNKLLIINIVLITILQFLLPWWIGALFLFGCGLFFIDRSFHAFALGILVLFIVWLCMALFQNWGSAISVADGIGDLIGGLPGFSVYLITALIGGIMGGLAAMTGTLLRNIFIIPKESN